MDKSKIEIENRFNDLSECTEYYYDELGKLDAVVDSGNQLNKKEAKKMHEYIIFFFFSDMDNLKKKAKASHNVENTEVEEFNTEFKKQHKTGVAQILLKPFKAIGNGFKALYKVISKKPTVEVLTEPEIKQIEGGVENKEDSSLLASPKATQEPEEALDPEVIEDTPDSELQTDDDCLKF